MSSESTLDVPILITIIILVFLSSFFSMSETIFTSVSESKLKNFVEERKTGAKKALYLQEHFDLTLTTCLVGNNIVNVALSTISVGFFAKLIINSQYIELISTLIITLVLLVFGEITPKTLGKKYSDRLSLIIGPIIYVISIVLYPIVWIFMMLQKLITGKENDSSNVDETELETILDTMEETGEIEEDEREFIRNVFDLNDRSVEDIMIPRIDMIALDITSTVEETKALFVKENFSRIPVYEGDKDHIVGILYERDYFTAIVTGKKDLSIKRLMRPAKFVNKTLTVDTLIRELQESKMHMAIVVGEYGDTLGLVTMEDALEEIVGEIYDEHDEGSFSQTLLTKIDDNNYYVDGEMFVSDLFQELDLGDAPEDVSKVSTWVFESQDDIPELGDKMIHYASYTTQNEDGDYEDYNKKLTFEVVKVVDRRIEKLKLTIEDASKEEIEEQDKE